MGTLQTAKSSPSPLHPQQGGLQ
ncbi:hypothetical protein LEMLEM_LOCUS24883 [Lemmus lemmus]